MNIINFAGEEVHEIIAKGSRVHVGGKSVRGP